MTAGIAEVMQQNASHTSQANGSLMRMAPVGIWAGSPSTAAIAAMADSSLTHPHPACTIASAAYAAAIAVGVQGAGRAEMLRVAIQVAQTGGLEAEPVTEVLRSAAAGNPPMSLETNIGWVVLALHNAFFHLAAGTPVEDALIGTAGAGGDTDTNAAIAGALLGAAEGRSAFPWRWVRSVLTCRPDAGLHVTHPRPDEYWPDDLPDLAEALLLSRPRRH
jgi:ADP-ribosylglycohydrolase